MTAEFGLLEIVLYFFGLFMIAEGVMPYFFTKTYKKTLESMIERGADALQRMGGISILLGCILVTLVSMFL